LVGSKSDKKIPKRILGHAPESFILILADTPIHSVALNT
jgi:hypothetical protein